MTPRSPEDSRILRFSGCALNCVLGRPCVDDCSDSDNKEGRLWLRIEVCRSGSSGRVSTSGRTGERGFDSFFQCSGVAASKRRNFSLSGIHGEAEVFFDPLAEESPCLEGVLFASEPLSDQESPSVDWRILRGRYDVANEKGSGTVTPRE